MIIGDIFLIFAQNIGCRCWLESPQWGGSDKYPQCMFLNQNKEDNIYPGTSHFLPIYKMGFSGVFFVNLITSSNKKHHPLVIY